MKSWLCGMGMVALAGLTLGGCGGDDSSPTTTTGTEGTGGAGGDPGGCPDAGVSDSGGGGKAGGTATGCTTIYDEDKITFTGTVAPMYTCTECKSSLHPEGPNACRNGSDCPIINTGKVRDIVRSCALGCRSYEPPMGTCEQMAKCNSDCVKMVTGTMVMQPGLSEGCGKCYTDIALCSIAFCISECSANADAIPCVQCQFANGCRVPFEVCSGVDRQP